ncbi:MAG: tripartite tricarboxylate transporter substrate binding protein [Betaproteobacteria bacterium]|nr:tripartite tricarboxylate transporter substrate binding protein [Betaproteobacteria bacterium]
MSALRLSACILAAALLTGAGAWAQSYPVKPMRVVTAEPGGGNDLVARMIGQAITPRLGQQWIIDNRGGAGGLIAIEIAAKAPADGYTLLVYAGNVWTIPLLRKNVPYQVKDFAPITWAARSPSTLVVHPSVPVHSVRDLIGLAKARPGQLSYGSGGIGTSTHLAAELFKSMAKVDILWVPYKGNGPAMNDLISGQVQLMFGTAGTVAPHIKSGRVRAIAVTSAEPSILAPGLPTVATSGLPGYESISIYGVFAPAGTPEAIIWQLNRAIVAVLNMPEIRERFFNVGMEAVGSTPEQFGAAIRADTARLLKVIDETGIRGD